MFDMFRTHFSHNFSLSVQYPPLSLVGISFWLPTGILGLIPSEWNKTPSYAHISIGSQMLATDFMSSWNLRATVMNAISNAFEQFLWNISTDPLGLLPF